MPSHPSPRCPPPPQVKNVNHIPWAIVGSITASGVLYFMLALALVLMTAPNIACPYADYFSSLNRLNFVTVFDAVGELGAGGCGGGCGAWHALACGGFCGSGVGSVGERMHVRGRCQALVPLCLPEAKAGVWQGGPRPPKKPSQ